MHRLSAIILVTVLSGFSYASAATINDLQDKSAVEQINLNNAGIVNSTYFITSPAQSVIDINSTNILLFPANNNISPVDIVKQPEITISSTKSAETLIKEVRQIIVRGTQLQDAIDLLNAILILAPSEYTEEAQEAIGLVYEQTRQYERAKTENKVFLALYPNSVAYTRIKERLIALEIAEPVEKTNILGEKKPRVGKDAHIEASIAEYYIIGGNSIDGTPYRVDQSTLISNIRTKKEKANLSGRPAGAYQPDH